MFKNKFWNHIVNFFLWAFYYVNDNKNVDVEHAQIMHCILCYNGPINASNPRTQARKGLISYCKINEMKFLKKHVGCRSCNCCKEVWKRSE
jgi:hypothetical protein